MLVTLILGVAAGWGAVYAEDPVRRLLAGTLTTDETPLTPVELRAYSIAVCLLVAAVLSMVLGVAHALPLTLGAALGVLGPRIADKFRKAKAPDYDS